MDWQDSGASSLKPLSDAELATALSGLDTEAAMALLEQQTELRKQQQALEELARQHKQLLDAEAAQAEPEAIEQLSSEELIGFTEEPFEDVAIEVAKSVEEPEAEIDIAASLNALYGAASVPVEPSSNVSTEVENVEQLITEIDEEAAQPEITDHLVDDLILQFGGKDDETEVAAVAPKVKKQRTERVPKAARAEGRSAWSLIANWNGSGALVVALLCGYSFAGFQTSLGSLLLGGFVAFVILGLFFAFGALAARRGKSLQQILARAIFGVSGNVIPATALLLTRLVGLAVALMSAALAINVVLPQLGLSQTFDVNVGGLETQVPGNILVAVAIAVLAGAISLLQGKALEITRVVLASLTAAAVLGVIAFAELSGLTSYRANFGYDLTSSLQLASLLVVTFGLLFATSSADENSRIRPTTVVPKFLAAGILNWLVAGLTSLAAGYALAKMSNQSPVLFGVNMVLAVLGIFAIATVFAQTSNMLVGLRIPKAKLWLRIIIVAIVIGFGSWLYLGFTAEVIWQAMLELLPVAGVPVAAWLGIFTADVVVRRTDYHLVSLEKNYGFYRGWNFANLFGWLLASAIGFGLIKSAFPMLTWVGYLTNLLGISDWLSVANLGIWAALAVGFVVPLISGIPRIKRQEAETLAIEARRQELKDVVGEFEV
ncbi:MAG: hypothetical protein ACKOWE_04525 [Micrococcales bacterium]